jgi:2',3'-cyclic-nucleotide 2'-phosphodiesterase (5'-nucleotidase family)
LDEGLASRLGALRPESHLYLDAGDSVKSGNLSVPLRPEPCWPLLAALELSASCPGNRESHVLESAAAAKLRGACHPMVCANWRRKDGSLRFDPSIIMDAAGLRVGIVGGMVAMVTAGMKSALASSFLWDPPIPAIVSEARRLRPICDLLLALSHIGHVQDLRLARACPELDLIIGGHSHTVLAEPDRTAGVPVVQAGSHGRFIGRVEWTPGRGLTNSELIPWRP